MANYMKDVAKMLEVEVGEIFTINDGAQYYFDCDGLHCRGYSGTSSIMLEQLLKGELSITRKPWKPKYNEQYFSVGPGGVMEPGVWHNDFVDRALYKLGNCYKYGSDAELNKDKWIAFYASDEVLEV